MTGLSRPPVGVGRVQRSPEFLVSKQCHTSIKSKTFQIVYNDLNKDISHIKTKRTKFTFKKDFSLPWFKDKFKRDVQIHLISE